MCLNQKEDMNFLFSFSSHRWADNSVVEWKTAAYHLISLSRWFDSGSALVFCVHMLQVYFFLVRKFARSDLFNLTGKPCAQSLGFNFVTIAGSWPYTCLTASLLGLACCLACTPWRAR